MIAILNRINNRIQVNNKTIGTITNIAIPLRATKNAEIIKISAFCFYKLFET